MNLRIAALALVVAASQHANAFSIGSTAPRASRVVLSEANGEMEEVDRAADIRREVCRVRFVVITLKEF